MDPSSPPIPPPLHRDLVFVTGKGGVGKSTVAAALGLIAARHGRRTIVAELARRDDVTRALAGERPAGAGAVFTETQVAPGLFAISIDPERAMEEYLVDQLPSRALAELLGSSRTFGYLAAATPGLRELLAMGKVWELAQAQRRTPGAHPYDLVIVDAPATGHGVAFLTAPRAFAAAAAVGPIARQARKIQALIDDPQRTAVLAVARGSESSVTETLALRDALVAQLHREPERVVVNAVEPRRFHAADLRALATLPAAVATAPPVPAALHAARAAHHRAALQQSQIARLRRHWGRAPVTLPHLFLAELDRAAIEQLAHTLERRL